MASKGAGGRGAILFGLLVVVMGLAGAVVLYLLSQRRVDDAIRDLARAPVGCDTTLSFTDTGTFYVFIEHLGRLDTLAGDCETPDEYSRDPDDQPGVTITVTDDEGNELDLGRLDDEFTYSLDDEFAGTATRQLEIVTTGDYVVTVESPDGNDFVVAVGRDPADAATTMRLGAIAAAIAGVVLGLGLVLLGVRRGRRSRRIAAAPTPVPGWPVGVPSPTAPPTMEPPSTPAQPAPAQSGPWSPTWPAGPPDASAAPSPPAGPPGDQAIPGPLAPPRLLAPPGLPTLPAEPTTYTPIAPPTPVIRDESNDADGADAPGDDGGDVRDDASR